jgi:hypothetical protein
MDGIKVAGTFRTAGDVRSESAKQAKDGVIGAEKQVASRQAYEARLRC